jgi:uncharacterized membrane protein
MDRASRPHLVAGLALLGVLLVGGFLLQVGIDGARFGAAMWMIFVTGLAFRVPPRRATDERRLAARSHNADG